MGLKNAPSTYCLTRLVGPMFYDRWCSYKPKFKISMEKTILTGASYGKANHFFTSTSSPYWVRKG